LAGARLVVSVVVVVSFMSVSSVVCVARATGARSRPAAPPPSSTSAKLAATSIALSEKIRRRLFDTRPRATNDPPKRSMIDCPKTANATARRGQARASDS